MKRRRIKQTWKNLKLAWKDCERCELHKKRNRVVFGKGPKNAKVLLIGEAPGKDEDTMGIPFIGRIGKMLTRILEVCKVDRKYIYICNSCGCRPPSNRRPKVREVKACFSRLKMEIELVKPKFIIYCGNVAAHIQDLSEEHYEFFQQFTTFGMFHPGSIRHAGPSRRDVIENQVKQWARYVKKKGVKL